MEQHPFISMIMILFRNFFPPVSVPFPELFVTYFLYLKGQKIQNSQLVFFSCLKYKQLPQICLGKGITMKKFNFLDFALNTENYFFSHYKC